MKILMPVIYDDSSVETLAFSFHEAKHICMYDLNDSSYVRERLDEFGGSMRSLPGALKQNGVATIISNGIRPLALKIFSHCGVAVYKAHSDDVEENIKMFKNGELSEYSVEASRELLECGGSCGTCSTDTCN